MKTRRLPYLLLLGCLTTQCATSPELAPAPTYDELSTLLLKELAPQVVGQWTLTEVRYTRRQFLQYPPSLPRDTVLTQFATLTIVPAPVPRPSRAGIPEFEGQLTYHRKTYPVRFALLASPERVVHQQGPPAHFLLEFNFPVGSHQTEPEEQFLQDIGLVGENFSLEVAAGQPTMHWQGLNRHLTAITLRK